MVNLQKKTLHRTMVTYFSEAGEVQTSGWQPDLKLGIGEA